MSNIIYSASKWYDDPMWHKRRCSRAESWLKDACNELDISPKDLKESNEKVNTITYQQWKARYYACPNRMHQRLGQAFIYDFIKVEDNGFDYMELWECKDVNDVEWMIAQLCSSLQWDWNSLILKEGH